jgi:hypothetical protein
MGVYQMNLLKYYPEISESYPEHITQKQMYEICGVSKSTIYKAERCGLLPFENEVNRLLHTHRIKLLDALAYKYNREHGYRHDDEYISYLRRFYVKRQKRFPDVLTVTDISEITGFAKQSVQRWIGRKYITAFVRQRSFHIPKESLLGFLVCPAYNGIQDKSEKQVAALCDFNTWYSARIGGVRL